MFFVVYFPDNKQKIDPTSFKHVEDAKDYLRNNFSRTSFIGFLHLKNGKFNSIILKAYDEYELNREIFLFLKFKRMYLDSNVI